MVRDIRLYGAVMVGLITIQALVSAPASPIAPCQAPPLPAPTGNVVTVSTEPDLQRAVANITAGQTIVIQPGTYNLATGGGTLYFHKLVDSVTIRGATNNCDDVILLGAGMTTQGNTPYGIWVGGPNNLLIANLQIRGVYYSPIQLDPNYGGTQSPRVYNVHLVDAGEQFIKVNPQSNLTGGVVNGIVEYSIIEYTATAPLRTDGACAPTPCVYTNGVDVHLGTGWLVRHNLFRNITAPAGAGLAGPAVLLWNGSGDMVVEGNLFLNCQRGIAMGLGTTLATENLRGIVRNNMFARTASQPGDVAISAESSPGVKILNNTVLLNGTYPNAIEYRFATTTNVLIEANLTDSAIRARDGATGTVVGNVTTAPAAWFVNAAAGDLHLTAAATGAIDQAPVLADVPDDYDGNRRPIGPSSDIGAHEYGGAGLPAAPSNLQVR